MVVLRDIYTVMPDISSKEKSLLVLADNKGLIFSVKGGEGIIPRGWGSRTSSLEDGEATQMRGTLENLGVKILSLCRIFPRIPTPAYRILFFTD